MTDPQFLDDYVSLSIDASSRTRRDSESCLGLSHRASVGDLVGSIERILDR